jgi:hypothetical protein
LLGNLPAQVEKVAPGRSQGRGHFPELPIPPLAQTPNLPIRSPFFWTELCPFFCPKLSVRGRLLSITVQTFSLFSHTGGKNGENGGKWAKYRKAHCRILSGSFPPKPAPFVSLDGTVFRRLIPRSPRLFSRLKSVFRPFPRSNGEKGNHR